MAEIRTIRYDDGRRCEQQYVDGKLHGTWTVYFANGQKEWERQHEGTARKAISEGGTRPGGSSRSSGITWMNFMAGGDGGTRRAGRRSSGISTSATPGRVSTEP